MNYIETSRLLLFFNYGIISELESEKVLFLSSRLESLPFIHKKKAILIYRS